MKKLLFALAIAGLWVASSFSQTQSQEREVEMKAMRAVDSEVGKYKATKLAGYYANEYTIMN